MDHLLFSIGLHPAWRPPDWRLRLACYLVDHPDHPEVQPHADLWVVQACSFSATCVTPRPRPTRTERPSRGLRDLFGREQLPRWTVEAHLLTGEPLDRVAERSGLGHDVLAVYHEIFFDVQDRLKATSYIAHHVIGRKLHIGLTEDDDGVLLKIAGFRGLGEVIGDLARHFRGPPLTAKDFDVRDPVVAHALWDRLWLKMWVASQTLPLNEAAVLAAGILPEIEKLLALPAEGEEVGVQALAARLRHANWAIDELRACLASARAKT